LQALARQLNVQIQVFQHHDEHPDGLITTMEPWRMTRRTQVFHLGFMPEEQHYKALAYLDDTNGL
jgi:hypothetical protein